MKYVFKKGIRKDATKQMEDICRLFFRHILDHVDHKFIVSLSEIVRQEDLYTVYNYRGLSDEGREIIRRSLEEDLAGKTYRVENPFSPDSCIDYFLSYFYRPAGQEDTGDFIIILRLEHEDYSSLIREYIEYQIRYCFRFLFSEMFNPGDNEFSTHDLDTLILSMINLNCRSFIDSSFGIGDSSDQRLPSAGVVPLLEEISSMTYENKDLSGRYVAIVPEIGDECDITLVQDTVVAMQNVRKVRKLLEITYYNARIRKGLYLVYNKNRFVGFIQPERLYDRVYHLIHFSRKGVWQVTRHNKGIPGDSLQLGGKYPLVITMNRDDRKELILGQFLELYRDLFGSGNDEDRLSDIIIRASSQMNGTILAIMENAREEAVRLQSAGFRVSIRDQNTMFTQQVTSIDGAVILDQNGIIYSIGAILDGKMPPRQNNNPFDLSRGARYNSAIKYSYSSKGRRHLIIVFSEDRDIDFIINGYPVAKYDANAHRLP